MKRLVFTIILAAVLWSIMFLPVTAPHINFWWMMTSSACILSTLSTIFNPGWWKRVKLSGRGVLESIAIAVALWGVFWIGDKLSQIILNFAVNGNQKCSDLGNSECSIFGIKTTVLLASAVQ